MDPIAILATAWRFIYAVVTSKSAGPIGAIVAVILLGANLHGCAKLHESQVALSDLQKKESGEALAAARTSANLMTCQANSSALETSLSTQKNALVDLKAKSDAATASANRQVQAAKSQAASAADTAARILAKPPGADNCKSALDLIRGG